MINTKNKKKLGIFTQKWKFNIFTIPLEGIERIYYRKIFNSSFVNIYNLSLRVAIFVRQFHYEKHYILHRLLYFIRAVCLPTSTVCHNIEVGYKSCKTLCDRKFWQ